MVRIIKMAQQVKALAMEPSRVFDPQDPHGGGRKLTPASCPLTHTNTHTRIHPRTHAHTHTHAHINTHTHAHTHAGTYTHTHSHQIKIKFLKSVHEFKITEASC